VDAPDGALGMLELLWLPPGGEWQILGPAHLQPALPLVQPPLPDNSLPFFPRDRVLETIE
jgi:hypothetical protein